MMLRERIDLGAEMSNQATFSKELPCRKTRRTSTTLPMTPSDHETYLYGGRLSEQATTAHFEPRLDIAEPGMRFVTSDAPIVYHWHLPVTIYGTGAMQFFVTPST